jgi:hypothetical protein
MSGAVDYSGDAWPAGPCPRRTIGGRTYCIGSAGSFILVCLDCGAERFRCEPDNPLETCWGIEFDDAGQSKGRLPCRGKRMYALDVVTLEKVRFVWGQILGA